MDPSLAFIDDLLDFNSDIGEGGDEEDEEAPQAHGKRNPNGSPDPIGLNVLNPCSVPATGEEELEWISNKEAFPPVYTFVGTLTDQSGDVAELSTPLSVLENTSTSSSNNNNNNNNNNYTSSTVTFMSCSNDFKVPSKVRSKFLQRRRQEISSLPLWIKQPVVKNIRVETEEKASAFGKKCQHCGSEETPQWRAGPLGPKTLCNACGVRFKSGRLVPEYRPANSPTFSHELHSNSHRKVMEMRRRKEKENSMNSVDTG